MTTTIQRQFRNLYPDLVRLLGIIIIPVEFFYYQSEHPEAYVAATSMIFFKSIVGGGNGVKNNANSANS